MRFHGATLPACILLLCSCIQRNNPWDPVNYHPQTVVRPDPLVLDAMIAELDSVLDAASAWALARGTVIDSLKNRLPVDSAAAVSVENANDLIRDANDGVRRANMLVTAYNDSAPAADSLRYQGYLDSLGWMGGTAVGPAAAAIAAELTVRKFSTLVYIDSVNALYPADTVCTPGRRGAFVGLFDSLLALCEGVAAAAGTFDLQASDTNTLAIYPYNRDAEAYNVAAAAYNDSVRYVRQFRGYPVVAATDSIEARLVSLSAGDTLVIGGGTFSPFIHPAGGGNAVQGVLVMGQPDLSTVFSQADVILSGNSHVTFRNIVFVGGNRTGVKLENGCAAVVFDRCVFENNTSHGLEVIDSDIRLQNCRILGNGGSGVRLASNGSVSRTAVLVNTLVAHNLAHGIDVTAVNLSAQNVTIADNGGNGVLLADPELDLLVYNTLVTHNAMYGLSFEAPVKNDNLFILSGTVLYGNSGGALRGVFTSAPAYLDIGVSYVNQQANDYAVAPGNRVYELEREGIVIGYR